MATTYKIGEAAALLNLKTYVLRFWETEFPEVAPLRTEKGQRLYTKEHLALLERIRFLLHDRGLTIGGARKALAEEKEKGVLYTFGRPGALRRDSATTETESTEEYGPEYELSEEESSENATSEPLPTDDEAFSPALQAKISRSLRPYPNEKSSLPKRRQYNLPGVEITAPVVHDLPEAQDEEDDLTTRPAVPDSTPPQGMLPLFAVVKTAFLAGKASGKNTDGGSNFIQAGMQPKASASTDGDKKSDCDACPHDPLLSQIPRSFLNEVAQELEAIADLLRTERQTDAPHNPLA